MSVPRTSFLLPELPDRHGSAGAASSSSLADDDGGDPYAPKPTYATFSPVTALAGSTNTSSAAKRRSVILVHQKSPLLLATPPQITRALAYSHPFLLPLNRLVGLLSWTTGDPWESFIVVLIWWGLVLYGDTVIRSSGPILLVLTLIAGMYGRRYSPLSSSGWGSEDPTFGAGRDVSSKATSGSGLGYFLFGFGAETPAASKAGRETAAPKGRAWTKHHGADKSRTSHTTPGKAGKASHGGGLAPGGKNHQRNTSEVTNTRHQKTLDEIVETLKELTARCNLLLEPLLELTDFLSTQSTPTIATTRPALTVLFVRILLCTPFWYILTLPPWRVITTRRVMLVFGTVILTWHSRPMRVSRTILWRSATVRWAATLVTGLDFEDSAKQSKSPPYVTAGGSLAAAGTPPAVSVTSAAAAAAVQNKLSSTKPARRLSTPRESELTRAIRRARTGHDAGVRFTFILYENQRRWVGLGWTTSLFAYERPSWTDEHNNAVPSKDEFELPEVEDGSKMRWRWVAESRWRVDGVVDDAVHTEKTGAFGEHIDSWDYDGDGGRMGWVYYDNKWQNGTRGQDGWSRWTRRRKWYRDAELVEVDTDDTLTPNNEEHSIVTTSTSGLHQSSIRPRSSSPAPSHSGTAGTTGTSMTSTTSSTAATSAGHDGATDRRSGDEGLHADADVDNTDAISLMSSRSARGKAPSLHRRITDASVRGVAAPAITTNATAMAIPTKQRGRTEEEDAAVLSTSAGVKLHEPRVDSWGIGDEAQMGLD